MPARRCSSAFARSDDDDGGKLTASPDKLTVEAKALADLKIERAALEGEVVRRGRSWPGFGYLAT